VGGEAAGRRTLLLGQTRKKSPDTFSSSLANANGPGDSSRGRILPRHCGGIVPPPRSSNIFDNETTNALQAESIGTFTQVPPDLKRCYFGHV
jgi:hypothetical protein